MNLVWHRADLRLHDHPALQAALRSGPTAGIVILDPGILENTTRRRSAWFLGNVRALQAAYAKRGGTLLVRSGVPWQVLPGVMAEVGAQEVFAIRNWTPYARHRDQEANTAVQGRIAWFPGLYVNEPGSLLKPDGGPYTVFTPFSKRWRAAGVPETPAAPERFLPVALPAGVGTGEVPSVTPDIPLPAFGEEPALHALEEFLCHRLSRYHEMRDGLGGEGVSRLSCYFNIGVLSPRLAARRALDIGGEGARKWIAELCWRDFSGDLLHHHPHMMERAFDPRWDRFPWVDDAVLFEAWLHGRTGIPVVDACMRELQATGFVSNRGRMVVAQFAVKLALLPWQKCERAFRHLLLDGDTASNLQGWQWAGGLGVDAAPYFRVFNMVTQARTHDPDGTWLRRWVPECGGCPEPYCTPVVDPGVARKRYLDLARNVLSGVKNDI